MPSGTDGLGNVVRRAIGEPNSEQVASPSERKRARGKADSRRPDKSEKMKKAVMILFLILIFLAGLAYFRYYKNQRPPDTIIIYQLLIHPLPPASLANRTLLYRRPKPFSRN